MNIDWVRGLCLTWLLISLLAMLMCIFSCKQDKCKDVTCYNNGNCDYGDCDCVDGYEGTSCETEMRAKFLRLAATVTELCDSVPSPNSTTDITAGDSVDLIRIRNLGDYLCAQGSYDVIGRLISSTEFVIDTQTVCNVYTMYGTGLYTGGHIDVEYLAIYQIDTNEVINSCTAHIE